MAVDTSFFTSYLSEEIRDEGRAQGEAKALLRLLERRAVNVPEEAQERIRACTDIDQLDRWFDRAVTAESAEELFAEE